MFYTERITSISGRLKHKLFNLEKWLRDVFIFLDTTGLPVCTTPGVALHILISVPGVHTVIPTLYSVLSSAVLSHRWGPQPTANARGKRLWWAQERGSSIKRDNGSLGSALSKSSPCLCSGCVPLKHIHSAPRFWIPVLTLGISPRY